VGSVVWSVRRVLGAGGCFVGAGSLDIFKALRNRLLSFRKVVQATKADNEK
jgi:hypothetical protein